MDRASFISKCIAFALLAASLGTAQTRHLDSLKALLPSKMGSARLEILYALSNQMEGTFPQEALAYGREGLALAEQLGDRSSMATLYSSLAYSSSELGNFLQSLRYGYQSLDVSTQIGDKKRMASANSVLGITNVYLGQFSKALGYHLEALRLREELGLNPQAATTLNNIGIVYHNIGQYDKAIEYYRRSWDRHGENLSTVGRVRLLTNIGFSEFKRGKFDEAMKRHTEALAMAESLKIGGILAYNYLNMGIMHAEKRHFALSLDYLHLSLRNYEELGQKHGIVQLLNALGTTYAQAGDPARSLHYLHQAVALAKQIRAPEQLKASYEALYDHFEKAGPPAKAFEYFKLVAAAKDSLLNSKESDKIAQISIEFEMLAKEREIELLKKEAQISRLNLEQQKLRSNFIIGGSVLLFFAAYALLILYRRIRTSKALVEQKNAELNTVNAVLQVKIGEINALSGLLPICANCKKIRDDEGDWEPLERYIANHSKAQFSHGICPDCAKELYPGLLDNNPES